MQNAVLAMLNGPEIILIFAVVLILFGAKRLPELARGLGQGLREFKKASTDIADDLQQAMHEPHESGVNQLPPAKAEPFQETSINKAKSGNAELGPGEVR